MMRRSKVASPAIVSLEDEIAQLRGLDLKVLRSRWQSVTGREAPSHLSRQLLFSMIAYRIQAEALGDLDAVTLRLLKKIGSNHCDHEHMALTEAFDQRDTKTVRCAIYTRVGVLSRSPKKRGPFHWVPVMAEAIFERLSYVRPSQAKPTLTTITR